MQEAGPPLWPYTYINANVGKAKKTACHAVFIQETCFSLLTRKVDQRTTGAFCIQAWIDRARELFICDIIQVVTFALTQC